MCGLFGKLYFDTIDFNNKDIEVLMDTIAHRGLDDRGLYIDNHIALGNCRLAICDKSIAGHMPMSNEDKSIWVTFNGEIYNYKELYSKLKGKHRIISGNDTELILHLYEEYGVSLLKSLKGMFAFGIWDKKKEELFIARDRLGKKPIKYYVNNSFFIFSSELKAILKDSSIKKELDYEAIDQYLTYQYVPSPRTGFKNIYKLQPGHFLIINTKKKKILKNYWKLYFQNDLKKTETEWEEKVDDALNKAVLRRIPAEVSYGVHLSGGIDSSLITAILKKYTSNVKTISLTFNRNQTSYAKKVAKDLNTEHYEMIMGPKHITSLNDIAYSYEEPFADSSAVATWYLSRFTKEHNITVALNGDGGDENFAGYERHLYSHYFSFFKHISLLHPLSKVMEQIPSAFFHRLSKAVSLQTIDSLYLESTNLFSEKEKQFIFSPHSQENISGTSEKVISKYIDKTKTYDNLQKTLFLDFMTYLSEGLLMKTDLGGMAHGLEIRSPFLDEDVISVSSKIPSKYKIHGLTQKYILKRIAEKYVPKSIIYQKKEGFGLPLDSWFHTSLKGYVHNSLLSDTLSSVNLFSESGIKHILYCYYEKNHNYSKQIWSLIMLKEWLSAWFS